MQPRQTILSSRRRLLAIVISAIVLVAGWVWWAWSDRPLNVVLVTFDTTRADRMGAYGYKQGLTQAFDDLARTGVVFDRAYAPVPLTLPSHTSMLTGLYPPEHGLRVNGSGQLGPDVPLLPQILKRKGYDTGAFVAAFVLHSKFGLNRGFDTYDDDLSEAKSEGEHSFDRRRTGVKVVDSALNWLGHRTSKPFFCWIHLYDAHAPYDARKDEFGTQFQDQPYDAGIAVEVQQLSRVMQFLTDRKLQDRTVVVVVGDHGEGLDEHGEEEHGNLVYNSTVQVPLVVAGPRDCRPGHRVTEPVSLVDLTPTLLDMLGLPPQPGLRGRSVRAALSGKSLPSRPCYVETEAPFLDNRWCPMHAVISDRWKYVHTTRGELFDLEQDPGETKNLWDAEPEQRADMHALLEEMQNEFVPLSAGNVHLSEKDQQILASLGYVGGKTKDSTQAKTTEVLPDMKDMLPYQAKMQTVRHLMDDGKIEEAIKLAREVVAATSSKYPMAEVTLGDLLRKQGATAEAAAAYQAVLKHHPDNVKAHTRLGELHASQRRWPQAVKEFRAVIELEPEASQAHFELAQTLSRMNQTAEAILEYQEAVRSDPGFVTAHFELGLLLAKLRRLKESIYYFEQALKYDPRLTEAHMNLGSVLLQEKRIPEALEHMRQAVESDPKSFAARINYGTILIDQNRTKEGLEQFREAERLRPDDPLPKQKIQDLESNAGREG